MNKQEQKHCRANAILAEFEEAYVARWGKKAKVVYANGKATINGKCHSLDRVEYMTAILWSEVQANTGIERLVRRTRTDMGKTVSDKAALSTKGAKFFKDVAALESRIAELEREVAFWKADASAARDIEQAAHKDAERYRWLRDPENNPAKVIDKLVGESPSGIGIWEYRAGDELDAAMGLTPNVEAQARAEAGEARCSESPGA